MTNQLDKAKKKKETLSSHLEQTLKSLNKLEADIGQYKEEVSYIRSQLEEARKQAQGDENVMQSLSSIEGQVDEAKKERNTITCQLEENGDDIIKLRLELTSLKAQSCEATKMKEEMEIILSKKDEEYKKMKEEIVFLKKEVDLLNKNLKSSQTLDGILSHQRSPLDKSGLRYASEPSSKNDANPNASNYKDVRKPKRNVDAPSSCIGRGKSEDNYGINSTPRRFADGVKNKKGNEYHQRIPRKKDFRSTSRKSSSPR